MNRKPHRVLKELKPIGVPKKVVVVQPKKAHPIKNAIKDVFAEKLHEVIDNGFDALVYQGIPYLLNEKVKPSIVAFKEYKKNGYKLKVDMIIEKNESKKKFESTQLVESPNAEEKIESAMTEEEINEELRKFVIHYIGMMESLKKLHNAGVIDKSTLLEQLTAPAAIEKFNQVLENNPNLIEMTQYISISHILGRDLIQNSKFIPITATEINKIAESTNLD